MSRWQFGIKQIMLGVVVVALGLVCWRGAWIFGLAWYLGVLTVVGLLRLRNPETPVELLILKGLTAYCLVSTITSPLSNWFWMSEIPVLALAQFPKLEFARWVQHKVVMEALGPLGLSRGSYSPESIMVRPYALALVYLTTLGLVLGAIWGCGRWTTLVRRWALILIVAALVDFVVVLKFGQISGGRLTLY